jgi:hypothetical protein
MCITATVLTLESRERHFVSIFLKTHATYEAFPFCNAKRKTFVVYVKILKHTQKKSIRIYGFTLLQTANKVHMYYGREEASSGRFKNELH